MHLCFRMFVVFLFVDVHEKSQFSLIVSSLFAFQALCDTSLQNVQISRSYQQNLIFLWTLALALWLLAVFVELQILQ